MVFKNRLPKLREIILVYAVNVVILYSFSLWFSFQDFSRNWILYLDIADILGLFAYIIIGAFIESLLMIGFLIILYLLSPPSITQGRFVLHGTILTITLLTALMLRDESYVGLSVIVKSNNISLAFVTVGILLFFFAAKWTEKLKSAIEALADRCVVFLYFYLPLSVLAMLIALVRNTG